jgi:shikimate kinase
VANAAARQALGGAGRLVYLRVPPAVAAARVDGARHLRPLLAGAADPLGAVGRLLVRRGPLYEAADAVVDAADVTPAEVADRVVAAVRGWEASGD